MSELVAGNQLELLCTGGEYFPALLAQIAQAKYEIRMETYIFEADVIGQQVVGALCAAAKRGVKVHLLVDGFGAAKFALSVTAKLRECGVEPLECGVQHARELLQFIGKTGGVDPRGEIARGDFLGGGADVRDGPDGPGRRILRRRSIPLFGRIELHDRPEHGHGWRKKRVVGEISFS